MLHVLKKNPCCASRRSARSQTRFGTPSASRAITTSGRPCRKISWARLSAKLPQMMLATGVPRHTDNFGERGVRRRRGGPA
jgi:hypothetical protein